MFSPAVSTTTHRPATGCRVSRSTSHATGAIAAVAIAASPIALTAAERYGASTE